MLLFKVTCMREILAEAWPSETLGLGGIFRIVSGKVNYLLVSLFEKLHNNIKYLVLIVILFETLHINCHRQKSTLH